DSRPEVRSGLASVSALCRHGEMKRQETMSNPVQRKRLWHKDNLTHRQIWGNCGKRPKLVLGTPGRRFKSCCPDHYSSASKRQAMIARIYKPAKTAMQSGTAKTKEWVLDYEPEQPRLIEPLMGWTSSGDMRQQVQLRFDTAEEAIAYCERHGIAYQIFKSKPAERRGISYADNFAVNRRDPWTH